MRPFRQESPTLSVINSSKDVTLELVKRKGDKTSHARSSWRTMLEWECHAQASSDKNTYVTPKAVGKREGRMSRHDKLLICITNRYDRPCLTTTNERSLRRLEQKNCSIGRIYHNYQLIMVMSTRDDSAVNAVLKLVKLSRSPKVLRLFKARRRISKKPREPTRTIKSGNSSTMSHLGRPNFNGSHVHNYYNVEISTRVVFAVITVIKYMGPSCSPELSRLSNYRRRLTKRSDEYRRRLKTTSGSKIYDYMSQTTMGNYTLNYPNVEISTRNVFAVSKQIQNGVHERNLFTAGQRTFALFSFYTKGGGAYNERGESKRGDKNVKKTPIDESNNRDFLSIFVKNSKIFPSLHIKIIGTFCKIWLYRTKARVRVTHRNEINRYEYAAKLCTVSYYNTVIGKKCHVLHMTAKISRIQSVTKQIDIIMSRLPRSARLKASYKYESMAPFINSIIKNNLNRQQITKTEFKPCQNMSEAEVLSAVEHIPGHSEQSVADMDGIRNLLEATPAKSAQNTSDCSAQTRIIYDPINDVYTHIPIEASKVKDVGEGRRDKVTNTGKKYSNKNKHVKILDVTCQKTELGITIRRDKVTNTGKKYSN